MAHGLLCIRCEQQETQHVHPEHLPEGAKCCSKFDDGIKHLKDCPRTDCVGNCKKTIKDRQWAATIAQHHAEHMLGIVLDGRGRPQLVMLDIGS